MPADVMSEMVVRKVMSSSIIMIQLIRNASEDAITIRLHAQNVASVGEVWLPEIIGTLQVCALGLLAHLKKTREVKWACRVEATSIMSVVKE